MRTDLKLSQEEISKKTNISRTAISNIELGRHQAPLHTLYKLADALNTEIHFLIPTNQEVLNHLKSSKNKDLLNYIRPDLTDQMKKEFELIFNSL